MRRRLAVIAAATTLMVAVAFVVPLGLAVRSMARQRALSQAREVTQILVPALALGDIRTTEVALASAASRSPGAVSAVTADGTVLGPALGAERTHLDRARTGEAFITATGDGVAMFTPVLTREPSEVAVVVVDVPGEVLTRGVAPSWAILGGLGLVLVVAAVIVADRLGRATVAATSGVSEAARRLSAGDLDARAQVEGPPEVADVAVALNRLADRIRDLLTAEREAAAEISHRLRTPLTALRVDVGELEDTPASRRLADALDDLERQIDRVIRDTRRPSQRRPRPIDVGEVVAERAAFWAVLAEDQDRAWMVETPSGVIAETDPDELATAIDALLGNVFAHTPMGTACRISVETDGTGARIVVDDAGPGFADDVAPTRGASGVGSTGLGLDIARRTAREAGGELSVERSPLGGARVVLDLPRA